MPNASPYIQDATADNFGRLVLANSEKGPVVVSYWSPNASPCMALMPHLMRVAEESGGGFLLVRLNTDEYSDLARDHGVSSLPTVTVYRHGRAVETLAGTESESALRQFVARHIAGAEPSEAHTRALAAFAQGDVERAVQLAAQALLANPRDPRIPIDLPKFLMLAGRFDEADELLRCLPPAAKTNPDLRMLAAHLGFIRVSQAAPPIRVLEDAVRIDPDDLNARHQLAAVKVVRDDYDGAMAQLVEIARRDPSFRDGAGRNGLLAIFDMLGDGDARVARYRPLLQGAPH